MGGFSFMWYIFSMSTLPQDTRHLTHPARHLFSTVGIVVFTVLILGSFFVSAFYLRSLIAGNQLAAVITSTLIDLANGDRKSEDLGTLTVNSKLVAAAQAKADDMAKGGYFAHVSPDGKNSWTWFKDAGYQFSYAGENLAVDFSDSEDVERAWMNSPTHRANIMNGKFTEIGIATAEGEYHGKHVTFVVQMFGRPAVPFASQTLPAAPAAAPTEVAVASSEEPAETVLGSAAPSPAASAIIPAAVAAEASAPLVESAPAPRYGSVLGYFASSPQDFLRAVYLFCALLILLALAATTRLEFKKHHVRHVFAAVFLLALMGGLFGVADHFIFTAPVIG